MISDSKMQEKINEARELQYQKSLDTLIKQIIEGIGEPPYSIGALRSNVHRLQNLIYAKTILPDTDDQPVSEPVAETAPAVEEPAAGKRGRRSKEQIALDQAVAAANAAKEKEAAATKPSESLPAGGTTPGEKLLFKYPNLASLTTALPAAKAKTDHPTAFTAVTDAAKEAVAEQIKRGSSHGNFLAKAAARLCGGDKIASVPPARWGQLVDLYELIKIAELSGIGELNGEDDAAYDKLLQQIIAGESLEAVAEAEDEL